MAEYNEVIRQFKRMCRRYYNGKKDECPLYCKGHGCNISHCRMLAFEDNKFANVVKTWAAEHKEPIYPTWFEYLYAISNTDYFDLTEFYTWMRHTPIPADIAQKLGIEPKER